MTVGPVSRDPASAAFFDGTAEGVLLLRTCPDDHWSEPDVACCTTCGSVALQWTASAGTGRVVTWTAVHGRPDAAGEVSRRVVAVVELDEGPWWWTALEAIPEPVEGLAVRVAFTSRTEESEAVPYFVAG